MNDITRNVRLCKTKIYKGTKVTTYYVRWKVGPREWTEPYRTTAQADSFRSSLLTAHHGEASSLGTGRTIAWQRANTGNDVRWYDFACAYADMKWKTPTRMQPNRPRPREAPLGTCSCRSEVPHADSSPCGPNVPAGEPDPYRR